MKTEIAFDVMTKILPDVVEILNDPNISAAKNAAQKENKTFRQAMLDLMPFFLVDHREAITRIFAGIQGKTVDQVKNQEFNSTMLNLIASSMEDVMLFFGFCLRMVMNV